VRLAVTVAGTDAGTSGIGTWVHAVLPRLVAALGRDLSVLGAREDLDAYAAHLGPATAVVLPGLVAKPGPSAAFHLLGGGPLAAASGADVLLLPAANRRLTFGAPVPTIAVVHDLAQLRVPGKYDGLRMFYLERIVVGALARATELVAVSRATRRDLAQVLRVPEARVHVIENGVDVGRFTPATPGDARVAAARRWLGFDEPYVLYLSRLEHPAKNHVRLVRAFAASGLAATRWLVLAGGDWGGRAAIEREVAAAGLGDRVALTGFAPADVVPGLVAGADVVAMVGLCEGFGLPAAEALAAGRPVVASSTGALPEVVGDLGALCDPHDEGAIRAALARASHDEALRARSAAEGRAHVARFDWDRTAASLLELAEATLRRGRNAA
jgi:glycosyltransferase involved in cell wall biosynthesis